MGAEFSQPPEFREPGNTISSSPDVRAQPTTDGITRTPPPTPLPTSTPPPQPPELKLPHVYDAIIEDADSPIVYSSIDKLYDKLRAGVFLNQKRKKYWVEEKNNSNCFMVFARDLSITWAEDNRYWVWSYLKETSDVSIEVAELVNVCWLEVHGKFETAKLSPGVVYEVVFVVMLKDPAYGWEVPVNLRLILPDGNTQQHEENFIEKQRCRWIEIPAGEFTASPEQQRGDIQFSLYEYKGGKWKKGLVIKGVAIRPKNYNRGSDVNRPTRPLRAVELDSFKSAADVVRRRPKN